MNDASSIKYEDARKYKRYSLTIVSEYRRSTFNPVVPAPIPLGKSFRIIDFLFWKQGVILAKATSPSAKHVNEDFMFFHFLISNENLEP